MKISFGGMPPVTPLQPAETVVNASCATSSDGWWQRFLNFYGRAERRHRYLTGVATSFIATMSGDLVAKGIATGRFPVSLDVRQMGELFAVAALCVYYGLESPEALRRVHAAFPIDPQPREEDDPAIPLFEGAEMMTGRRSIGEGVRRLMSFFGRKITSVKRRIAGARQGIMRALAYRLGIAPWWTMRHMALMGILHGNSATPSQIVGDSLMVWLAWLAPLSVEEYIVQTKIPLEQRFLATSMSYFCWQVSVSLMVLLGWGGA